MTITFTEKGYADATSLASITVASGDCLVVFAGGDGGRTVSSISWNGQSLSLVDQAYVSGKATMEVWALLNATGGTGTISVTWSGAESDPYIAALTINDSAGGVFVVDTTGTVVGNMLNVSVPTDASVTKANCAAVSAISTQGSISGVAGDTDTIYGSSATGSNACAVGYEVHTAASGTLTANWTNSRAQVGASIAVFYPVVAGQLFERSGDDTSLGISDSAATAGQFSKSLTDALAAADEVAKVGVFAKALQDALGVSDTVVRATDLARTISDALVTSDTAAPLIYGTEPKLVIVPKLNGVDKLPAALTINSQTVYPLIRHRGGDATTSAWPAWGYGEDMVITGSGSTPTPNVGSPLLGPSDDSVLYAGSGKWHKGTNGAYQVGTGDFVVEWIGQIDPNACCRRDYSNNADGTNARVGIELFQQSSSLKLNLTRTSPSLGYVQIVSAALTPYAYYHALCIVDRSGFGQWWVNGVKSGSSADVSGFTQSMTNASYANSLGGGSASSVAQHAISYFAIHTADSWLDTYDQDAFALERFQRLTGFWPIIAAGTEAWTSFTRATPAYLEKEGKLYFVGAGWPRVDDSLGEAGYLPEPATKNILGYSSAFDSWTPTGSPTVVANAAVAPDGTTTADQVTVGASGTIASTLTELGTSDGVAAAGLWWKRISTSGTLKVLNSSGAAYGEWSIDVSALPDAWVRLWHGSPYVTVDAPFVFATDRSGGMELDATTGDIVGYAWNGQICDRGGTVHPGSDIVVPATTGVTRNADVLKFNGDNVTPGQGTIKTWVILPDAARAQDQQICGLSDGASATEMQILFSRAVDGHAAFYCIEGTAQADITDASTDLADETVHEVACSWTTDYFELFVDGASEGTPDTSGTPTADVDQIVIGAHPTGVDQLDGALLQLEVYGGVWAVVKDLKYGWLGVDWLALADTVEVLKSSGRSASDALVIADTVARALFAARAPTDQLTAMDTAVRSLSAVRGADDSLGASDAVSREAQLFRSITDALISLDSTDRVEDASRLVSDALALTDTVLKTGEFVRAASDLALALADASSRELTQGGQEIARGADDALGIADSVLTALTALRSATDSLTTADTVSRETQLARQIQDSLTATDAASRIADSVRAASDSLTVEDAASRAMTAVRTLAADALALSDSAATQRELERQIADALIAADTAARVSWLARAVADALDLTEAVEATAAKEGSAQDALSIVDTVQRELWAARTITDALALTDRVGLESQRTIADALATVDSVSRVLTAVRTASDQAVLSDAVGRAIQLVKTLSDSLTTSDSVSRAFDGTRAIMDSLAVSDSASSALEAVKVLTDSLAVADSAARAMEFQRGASDTLGVSDTVSAASSMVRVLTDALGLAESVLLEAGGQVAILNTLHLTDSVLIAAQYARALSDTLGASDNAARTATFGRSASDALVLGDAVSRAAEMQRRVSDALAVTDSTGREAIFERLVTESLTVADSLLREATHLRTVLDALVAADSIQITAGSQIVIVDTLTLQDSVGKIAWYARQAVDVLALADAVARAGTFVRATVTDALTTSDAAATATEYVRDLIDTIASVDYVSTDFVLGVIDRLVSDAFGLADSVRTELSFARLASDSLASSDSARAAMEAERGASDALDLVDSASRGREMERGASDTLALADAVAREADSFRSVIDALQAQDTVDYELITPLIIRELSELLGLSDSVRVSMELGRAPSDTIRLTDSVQLLLLAYDLLISVAVGANLSLTADVPALDASGYDMSLAADVPAAAAGGYDLELSREVTMGTTLDLTAAYITSQGARPLYAGDDYTIQITATRDGMAINISKAWFTVKRHTKTDPDSDALVALSSAASGGVTLLDAAAGKLLITLTPALTAQCEGRWYYDVQVLDADSNEIVTVLSGQIEFGPNTTRAYS